MFDLEYRPAGPFIPLVAASKVNFEDIATAEELAETNENVEVLSDAVETLDAAVTENTAAITENATGIQENKTGIEELNDKVDKLSGFKFEIVDSLPATGDSSTVYLVPDTEAVSGENNYKEYIYTNGQWEEFGPKIDLSGYVTKETYETGMDDVYTKEEADAKFLTEHQDISALATKSEVTDGLATKADAENVYTKDEADAKFITEHQDISELATKDELELVSSSVTAEAEARASGDLAAVSAIESVTEVLNQEVAARESAIEELRGEIVALPKFRILIVDELPSVGDGTTLYLVKTGDDTRNEYTEYVYVNDAWEEIGIESIDLSDYVKFEEFNSLSGRVESVESELASVEEKLIGLAEVNLAQDTVIATKANASDVYSKADADITFETVADFNTFFKDYKSVKALLGLISNDTPYGLRTNWSATTYAELTGLTNGSAAVPGTYNLLDDITEEDTNRFALNYGGQFNPTMIGKLNLGGHNIETSGWCKNYMIRTAAETTLTITGGNVTNINTLSAFTDNVLHNTVFMATSASTMNLSLGTSKSAKTFSDDPVVVCQDEATINITNGYYTSPNSCVIYCMGGLINITGGVFRSTAAEGPGFLINCLDSAYTAEKANIVVSSTSKTSGPKFWDFNPADNNAEGEHTSFVAEGCGITTATVVEGEVEHTVYTVIKL